LLCPMITFGQISNVTEVNLTFTPVGGGTPVIATAQDDGSGLQVVGSIDLTESTEYELGITLGSNGTDLTPIVQQNANDYLFFFAFADEVITSPAGDGNVDNRADPINYNDSDANSLPIGLSTNWTTECVEGMNLAGTFQLLLQYQVGTKSATSTATDGINVLDLTWNINVVEDPNAPPCENEEEVITDVTLTFTPVAGDAPVVTATAVDPDGFGPQDLQPTGDINLLESTEYTLTIELLNSIAGESITEEIMEEDDEHMFFFAFNDEVFTSPAGDGNTDNRDDPINYNDFDENGLPVGLSTNWTTECIEDMNVSGTFQVILKHQPGIKSATSTIADGGTDINPTWNINVVEDPNAPPCENEEEVITDVILTFTPVGDGDVITATAQDPDGPGAMDLQVTGDINLLENTEYILTLELLNSIEGESITEEIMEEDDEHMFFFAWTEGLFTDPMGDGNADNRDDAVNYNDFDENGLPVGLSTNWTTSAGIMNDTLRIVLKHQPGVKSATSTIDDGGTDVDLTWNVNTVLTSTNNIQVNTTDLRISPNPVRNILQWRIDDLPTNEGEVKIVDQFGRIISVNRNPQPNLDVSHLPKGIYTLQVRSEDKIWTQRFVKL